MTFRGVIQPWLPLCRMLWGAMGQQPEQDTGAVAPVKRGPWRLTVRTAGKAWYGDIFSEAAEAAFWQTLSLPPLLLGLLGCLSFVGDWFGPQIVTAVQSKILSFCHTIFSPNVVDQIIAPTVVSILTGAHTEVASIGFLISLWAGSSATATFVNTITLAYGMRYQRSAWRSRLLAFELYLLGVLGAVVVLPMLVLGPGVIVDIVPQLKLLVQIAYWPVVALISMTGVATLYHLSLPVRTTWRRDVPGAVVAVGIWILGSYVLREYIQAYVSRESAYGQLGAVVASLLFLYFTAMAVLFGAELNAEIDKLWPTEVTAEVRRREHAVIRQLQERREAELEWARSEALDDTGEWRIRPGWRGTQRNGPPTGPHGSSGRHPE
jgi:membrane protein